VRRPKGCFTESGERPRWSNHLRALPVCTRPGFSDPRWWKQGRSNTATARQLQEERPVPRPKAKLRRSDAWEKVPARKKPGVETRGGGTRSDNLVASPLPLQKLRGLWNHKRMDEKRGRQTDMDGPIRYSSLTPDRQEHLKRHFLKLSSFVGHCHHSEVTRQTYAPELCRHALCKVL
jgi:hypothetical protein